MWTLRAFTLHRSNYNLLMRRWVWHVNSAETHAFERLKWIYSENQLPPHFTCLLISSHQSHLAHGLTSYCLFLLVVSLNPPLWTKVVVMCNVKMVNLGHYLSYNEGVTTRQSITSASCQSRSWHWWDFWFAVVLFNKSKLTNGCPVMVIYVMSTDIT